jgi:acetolactate synthase regulatory subunit
MNNEISPMRNKILFLMGFMMGALMCANTQAAKAYTITSACDGSRSVAELEKDLKPVLGAPKHSTFRLCQMKLTQEAAEDIVKSIQHHLKKGRNKILLQQYVYWRQPELPGIFIGVSKDTNRNKHFIKLGSYIVESSKKADEKIDA